MKMNFLLPMAIFFGSMFLHAMNDVSENRISLQTYNRRSDFEDAADNRGLNLLLRQEVLHIDKQLVSIGIDDFEIIAWSDDCVSFKFNNNQHPDYFAQHIMLNIENCSITFKRIRMAKIDKHSDENIIQKNEVMPSIISFNRMTNS